MVLLMRLCMLDSLLCGFASADASKLRSSAAWHPAWNATSSTSTASSRASILCIEWTFISKQSSFLASSSIRTSLSSELAAPAQMPSHCTVLLPGTRPELPLPPPSKLQQSITFCTQITLCYSGVRSGRSLNQFFTAARSPPRRRQNFCTQ